MKIYSPVRLSSPEHKVFPPLFAVTLYGKRVFALTAPPDPEFPVVVRLIAAALGTPRPYFLRGLFIH